LDVHYSYISLNAYKISIAGVSTERSTSPGYYQQIAYLFQYAEDVLLAADQISHVVYKIQLLGPGETKEDWTGLDR